ncbi:hypothetical protein AAHC03_05734 [Spirometra sp. Aus1]
MFIELCQLTNGVPRSQVTQQEPAGGQSRYWRERYRWVEMEEAFDDSVGEFAPPEVPKFTYAEVNNFKRRVKKDLAFQLADSTNIGEAFRQACERAVNSDDIYAACKKQLGHWTVQSEERLPGQRVRPFVESDPFEDTEIEEETSPTSATSETPSSNGKPKSLRSRCYHQLCPPLHDLALGLVTLIRRYPSDFRDAFVNGNASVTFKSIVSLYFVIFPAAITFGTLMAHVDPAYTVSNSILTSGIITVLNSMFAGQPIAIVGPAGAGFLMEKMIAREAKELKMNYFIFRAWVLVYEIVMGIVLLFVNASALALRAKKSMEELFIAFICGFLIIKAMFSLLRSIPQTLPSLNTTLTTETEVVWRKAVQSGVNVFIALLMVCFLVTIVKFRESHLFGRRVRFWIGALSVPLGIIAMAAVNRIFFWTYDIARLHITPANHLNYSSWFNIPDLAQMTNYGSFSATHVQGRAVIFGFILGIFIFVEIALNSIVPLRGLSKKPSPIVVDHVLSTIIFPLLALFLGLPIMSGVPIRTIANMVALAKVDPHPAPGKPPKVLYLVETRVNTIIVGILVTLSVFLGNILQYIPVAALLGLFLFLGIFGLKGLYFRKILTATFSRRKYWSEWNVLDGMPRRQLIVFTAIWNVELLVLCALLVLGEYENLMLAATAIPFYLVFCGVFRNQMLPRWKWIAPYLEKIDPPCSPETKTKSS